MRCQRSLDFSVIDDIFRSFVLLMGAFEVGAFGGSFTRVGVWCRVSARLCILLLFLLRTFMQRLLQGVISFQKRNRPLLTGGSLLQCSLWFLANSDSTVVATAGAVGLVLLLVIVDGQVLLYNDGGRGFLLMLLLLLFFDLLQLLLAEGKFVNKGFLRTAT